MVAIVFSLLSENLVIIILFPPPKKNESFSTQKEKNLSSYPVPYGSRSGPLTKPGPPGTRTPATQYSALVEQIGPHTTIQLKNFIIYTVRILVTTLKQKKERVPHVVFT